MRIYCRNCEANFDGDRFIETGYRAASLDGPEESDQRCPECGSDDWEEVEEPTPAMAFAYSIGLI